MGEEIGREGERERKRENKREKERGTEKKRGREKERERGNEVDTERGRGRGRAPDLGLRMCCVSRHPPDMMCVSSGDVHEMPASLAQSERDMSAGEQASEGPVCARARTCAPHPT